MIKFAICCAVLFTGCMTEQSTGSTGSTTQEQCVEDPTTGICPAPDTAPELDAVRHIEHTQYPTYIEAGSGCSHHSDGLITCWGTITGAGVTVFVQCEGYVGGGVTCIISGQSPVA